MNKSKNLPYFPLTAAVSELQKNYSVLMDSVRQTGDPLILLKNNKPAGVLLSPEAYESLRSRLREYEEKELDEALKVYDEEKKNGKLMKLTSVNELFD